MRAPLTFASAALLLSVSLGALPAHAECKRFGFTVNDYGKEGPIKDAKALLDKHIAEWAGQKGIKNYQTGKKDINCELFLNFIVFDEHTCTASANVCWGDGVTAPAQNNASAGAPPAPVRKAAHEAADSEAAQAAAPETAAPAMDAAASEAKPEGATESAAAPDAAATGTAPAEAKAAADAMTPSEPSAPAMTVQTPPASARPAADAVETGALAGTPSAEAAKKLAPTEPGNPAAAALQKERAAAAAASAAAAAERAASAAETAASAAKEAAAAAVAASAASRGAFVPPLDQPENAKAARAGSAGVQ